MKKAFTLIELLIVLAIIGTLVAVAVVRFANLASDRDIKVCQANLRSLDSAISIYRVQESQWPQDGSGGSLVPLETRGYILDVPACPGGGTYSVANPLGGTNYDRAQCNIAGHTLPQQ
jgi:prepilin-type N-terminal cleavage/methylation domain-containing protein